MRLIKLKEVMKLTALGRSSIYKLMKDGSFPQSISLGERSIAWEEGEVEDWVQIRIDRRQDIIVDTPKENVRNISEADVITYIRIKFQQLTIADAITWLIQISK
jgi:prophage regulatory protein